MRRRALFAPGFGLAIDERGTPLPKSKDGSGVWRSRFHEEMQAAKAWNRTPDQWYAESRAGRATMFEFERAAGDINSYVTKS